MDRLAALLTIAWLFASGAAQAVTLGFAPSTSSVFVGSSVAVNVVISGLGDSAAPSLGTFDLDVLFDPAVLGLTGVVIGDGVLGDQLDLAGSGSLSSFDDSSPGIVNVFELSFDLPADLDDLQAGSFTLATLTFDALAEGTSTLGFASVVLGDAVGDPLVADISPGSVEVSALPEPRATALLLLSSLCLIAMRLRLS